MCLGRILAVKLNVLRSTTLGDPMPQNAAGSLIERRSISIRNKGWRVVFSIVIQICFAGIVHRQPCTPSMAERVAQNTYPVDRNLILENKCGIYLSA
ncbi:hypothetical protein M422DRAFT_24260 [Sphaerobolus stellatus SS14]|nr:hypothetical protein M422DRAFT_24260 [Sphaerobolus stellatus SS14]